MELSDFQTVEVFTLDKENPCLKIFSKVNNNQVLTTDLHQKVCDTLGLSQGSQGSFALFLGGLTPVRKLRPYDCITLPVTGLTFQKWCFDPKKEKELLMADENAVHWLFVQALSQIETGILMPTKEQSEELEGCLDPDFCTEKQYVQICHKVERYFEFCLDSCRLLTEIPCADHPCMVPKHAKGSAVSVTCSKNGLALHSEQTKLFSWFTLETWSLCSDETSVTFTFHIPMATTSTITIQTKHAPLLVSAVMEFIRLLRVEKPDLPPFHSSMVKSLPDGSTVWENSLFNAT